MMRGGKAIACSLGLNEVLNTHSMGARVKSAYTINRA
jgi:hypothetical protein